MNPKRWYFHRLDWMISWDPLWRDTSRSPAVSFTIRTVNPCWLELVWNVCSSTALTHGRKWGLTARNPWYESDPNKKWRGNRKPPFPVNEHQFKQLLSRAAFSIDWYWTVKWLTGDLSAKNRVHDPRFIYPVVYGPTRSVEMEMGPTPFRDDVSWRAFSGSKPPMCIATAISNKQLQYVNHVKYLMYTFWMPTN